MESRSLIRMCHKMRHSSTYVLWAAWSSRSIQSMPNMHQQDLTPHRILQSWLTLIQKSCTATLHSSCWSWPLSKGRGKIHCIREKEQNSGPAKRSFMWERRNLLPIPASRTLCILLLHPLTDQLKHGFISAEQQPSFKQKGGELGLSYSINSRTLSYEARSMGLNPFKLRREISLGLPLPGQML